MVTKKPPTNLITTKDKKPSTNRNPKITQENTNRKVKTTLNPDDIFITLQEKKQRVYLNSYINLIQNNGLTLFPSELAILRKNVLSKINEEGFIPNNNLFLNILDKGLTVVDKSLSPQIVAAIIQSIITKNDKICLKLISPLNEKLIAQYTTLKINLSEAINRIISLPSK